MERWITRPNNKCHTASAPATYGGVVQWEKMVVNTKKLKRICQVCKRVEELDRTAHNTRKGEKGCLPTLASHNPLSKTLEKHGIFSAGSEVGALLWWCFLGNLIHDFGNFCPKAEDCSKSVNYVCFVHDFFQAVPQEAWPRKTESLERLSPVFENIRPKT